MYSMLNAMKALPKKVISILLIAIVLPGLTAFEAGSKSIKNVRCSNPFPSNYKSPRKTKNVKIVDLGISVRVPVDNYLVNIKDEQRFTFMTPPEYKSYQCSLLKKVKYTSVYPYSYQLSYTVIDNPNKMPLSVILKETYKDDISIEKLGKLRINDIDFMTTPSDQGDPSSAWFIPKLKPGIVVGYRFFCDCGRDYNNLKDDLGNIKNLSR
jgi:hypothetical protein